MFGLASGLALFCGCSDYNLLICYFLIMDDFG